MAKNWGILNLAPQHHRKKNAEKRGNPEGKQKREGEKK